MTFWLMSNANSTHIFLVLATSHVATADTVINFDDLQAKNTNSITDVLRLEYVNRGVSFNSDGRHAGLCGMEQPRYGRELEPGGARTDRSFWGHNLFGFTGLIEFVSPIRDFKVDAAAANGSGNVIELTVRAFDVNGVLLER